MRLLKEVNIGNIEIVIKGEFERHDLSIGALTLSVDGREFILDVVQSYTDTPEKTGDGTTRITCDIEVDEDTFDECPYDITRDDLLNCEHNDLVRELFVDGDNFVNEIESITLYFEIDGQDYSMLINEE